MGCGASDSDEEDVEESLAIAEGLADLSVERRVSICCVPVDLPEVSRFRWARGYCLSAGVRGEAAGEIF